MTAPVTILADGTNSRLALGTPIRPMPRLSGESTELGIKEVYRLDPQRIEERFSLGPGEGHAEEWVAGLFPPGVMGGGFLYTNRDTLSVGLILNIQSLFGRGVYAHDLIEQFRHAPDDRLADQGRRAGRVRREAGRPPAGRAVRPRSTGTAGWSLATPLASSSRTGS